MLLADKRLLITGVLNDASIAYSVARIAQRGVDARQPLANGAGRGVAERRVERGQLLDGELDAKDQRGQRVVDLVGDAGGERADRRHPVGHQQLFVHQPLLGPDAAYVERLDADVLLFRDLLERLVPTYAGS